MYSLNRLLAATGARMSLREFKEFVDSSIIPKVCGSINDKLDFQLTLSETFSTNLEICSKGGSINLVLIGHDHPRRFSSKEDFYVSLRRTFIDQVRAMILSCFPSDREKMKIFNRNSGRYIDYYREEDNIEYIMAEIVIDEVEKSFEDVDVYSIFEEVLRIYDIL